ncbi:cupin-like domain-containing protein [Sphingomonas canadensis]|uniref:Cupin-like domain-containing protein n=1 Tax=Sphingomonas canadensis TaxID=1219257 RepID=A0ABW3H316_9SPHN|nr:cupin-like domain-containing protein [Sphingomonas canadensis]MCW3835677.1 cupin-like domain-containing protein [Sphingomonas canadensis]
MEIVCYVMDGWKPRIRPAAPKREWMEASFERFAYRCLPLAIANSHGWEVLSPCGFEARWNGGLLPTDVEVRADPGANPRDVPVALFGQATITFHIEGIIRTPPGWNLWVGGSPNSAKDGIAPLGGVIETDWSPYSFTMNWRFTRPNQWIRFEENEPFCFFFPVQRNLLEGVEPEIRPLSSQPELERDFLSWSASRDAFQKWVEETHPTAPADKWQKLYYRGLKPDGEPGAEDHVSKLRLPEFRCPAGFHAPKIEEEEIVVTARVERKAPPPPPEPEPEPESEAVAVAAAPAAPLFTGIRDELAASLTPIDFDALFEAAPPRRARNSIADQPAVPAERAASRDLARRDWTLAVAERQRALSTRTGGIPRVHRLSGQDFLDEYYAPGRPVIITGAMEGWPALERWTPEYLKQRVGAAPIEFQGGREAADDFELLKDNHKHRMAFDAFIDLIGGSGGGNDAYLTAYNASTNREALAVLDSDLGHLGEYLTRDPGMLWIGPAGTFTPLHFDLTNNLLAQVVGTKCLVLVPPSETPRMANHRHVFSAVHDITDPECLARYPQARDVRQFEVELNPGDLLYIPVGWWHQVAAATFSVMLTYTSFRWPNDAYETFPGD